MFLKVQLEVARLLSETWKGSQVRGMVPEDWGHCTCAFIGRAKERSVSSSGLISFTFDGESGRNSGTVWMMGGRAWRTRMHSTDAQRPGQRREGRQKTSPERNGHAGLGAGNSIYSLNAWDVFISPRQQTTADVPMSMWSLLLLSWVVLSSRWTWIVSDLVRLMQLTWRSLLSNLDRCFFWILYLLSCLHFVRIWCSLTE